MRDRIAVRTPNLARYLAGNIGLDITISPYVTIVADDHDRFAWHIPCVRTTRTPSGRIIHTDMILTLDMNRYISTVLCEVWLRVGDQLIIGMNLDRAQVEHALINDEVFMDENPSAYPTDTAKNKWQYPSTRNLPGWEDESTVDEEAWDEVQTSTLIAVQGDAWEALDGDPEISGPFRTVGDPDDPF